MHWIGEQYTPVGEGVGEAAVATRAAAPAYTELATSPPRRRVSRLVLGAGAAGVVAIVAGFLIGNSSAGSDGEAGAAARCRPAI